MSERNNDRMGRWRSKTVAFRVSEEENRQIESMVAMTGLTKQEYITSRLLNRSVVVVPSSRVQKGLEDVAAQILAELRRIQRAGEIPVELSESISMFAEITDGLGGEETAPEAATANSFIRSLERGE